MANVSGAVLVGGASRRMGRDKAHIEVAGEPLAVRTARLLDAVCDDVLLVGGIAPAAAPGRPVSDPDDGAPPSAMRGLLAALEAARSEEVLVVATDLPHLHVELLLGLVAWPRHEAVVPRDLTGRLHPLCALYRREPALAAARDCYVRERYALRGVLEALDTSYLEGSDLDAIDPGARGLTNVNTPAELARALG